jgi:hypothetical protein
VPPLAPVRKCPLASLRECPPPARRFASKVPPPARGDRAISDALLGSRAPPRWVWGAGVQTMSRVDGRLSVLRDQRIPILQQHLRCDAGDVLS